jgi:hypothetical protein
MIAAQDLLTHAEELLASGRRGQLTHVSLRRSISAAYYALFHQLLADAADALVGKTKRAEPAYGIVYRAFEHRRMRERANRAINLSPKLANTLGVKNFSDEIRDGASAFIALQAERHRADYDPSYKPSLDIARAQIAIARDAIDDFSNVAKGEYQLFLLMLLFDPRE